MGTQSAEGCKKTPHPGIFFRIALGQMKNIGCTYIADSGSLRPRRTFHYINYITPISQSCRPPGRKRSYSLGIIDWKAKHFAR